MTFLQLAGEVWQAITGVFIAAFFYSVGYGVVRGRRRSQRLFVDRPNQVLATLKHDRSDNHIWDAW